MNRCTVTLFLSSLLLGSATLLLGACHTIEGMGRDVAATGSGVAVGADETRRHVADQPGPGSTTQPANSTQPLGSPYTRQRPQY
jgi:predicted small secreted protein